jgi:hypothetical protein
MKSIILTAALLLSVTFIFGENFKGSRGGHYSGGHGGSSHKGSHYVNAKTGNHYTHKK